MIAGGKDELRREIDWEFGIDTTVFKIENQQGHSIAQGILHNIL